MAEDEVYELPTWALLPARPHPAFDALARTLAEELAAPMAFVVLVTKGGQVFPGAAGLPTQWEERRSTPLSGSPSQRIACTGRPFHIRDIRADPELAGTAAVSVLGIAAYAGTAVPDAEGRPLGVLCAVDTRPRDWTEAELATLERLAVDCSSLLQASAFELAEREAQAAAERAAIAAQQTAYSAQAALEEAEAEADRARIVTRLSVALLSAGTLVDVLRCVDRLIRSPLGAAGAVLGLAEAGSRVVRAWPTTPSGPGEEVSLELDDDHPLAVAIRDRRVIPVAGREGAQRLDPAAHGLPGSCHGSLLAVPLQLGQHSSAGGLLVSWSGGRELDQGVQLAAGGLAQHVGLALDRVLLAAARARLGGAAPGAT